MYKRVTSMLVLYLVVALLFQPHLSWANQFPERPPIPTQARNDEAVVIVEVNEDMLETVMAHVHETIPGSEIRKMFKLLSGFSIKLQEQDLTKLKEIEGVKRVDKISTYQTTIDESVPFIGGGMLRNALDEQGEHLTGKGVKVAVIDTGIDYNHPDLKASYKGGFDVVDCDSDPMETQSSQGIATIHGTHVAGIIAANGQVKGVAPEVELYVYRALGPGGQGTTEQVIEAIEKAVEDGVDVINLSLGNTVNGPDWPTSIALDKAVEKGVVAVTSNGNSGPNMWTVGSPGTSEKAISVGASSPPLKTPYLTIFGEDKEISIQGMGGAAPWSFKRDFPLIDGHLGMEEDLEGVEGKIVLIQRGILPFSQKAENAMNKGARGVIIYNNTDGEFSGALDNKRVNIPVVSISKSEGEWLLSQIHENKYEIHLRTIYREEEDFIASFSSRGPVTHTWSVKPDIVAPGVSIDSTIPNGYLGLNGTSMAAPHVAGAAAILKQAHPDWKPDQIKAALMNTAKRLTDRAGHQYLPHVQGAGRIQLDKALQLESLVYPGALSFGKWSKDDRRETKEARITVENVSKKQKTYYITPPINAPDGIQWKTPFSFSLKPSEKREITITMDIFPSVLKEGIHHGEIIVSSSDEEIYVPYLFFIEEPNYPRIMAFNFEHADDPNKYRYEMYLPGGAEELGIAIYDPDTFQFIDYLDTRKDVDRGLLEIELDKIELKEGVYKALVFAKQDGREDTLEMMINIGEQYILNKENGMKTQEKWDIYKE